MKLDSKYFDRIRARKRGKKSAPRAASSSVCQWDSCKRIGEYRAPVGSGAEGQFFLFCFDHVKRYNKGYNYFLSLSDDEIGRYQKEAVTGHRFTWTVISYAERYPLEDGFNDEGKRENGNSFASGRSVVRRMNSLECNAFETLGLLSDSSPEEIRGQYKNLVKRHHPDSNGGDRGSEERFQAVVQAYRFLKQSGFC
ncbi:J domain-containing protein [Candidatus Liberibacter sp.]|uniref:J domain-containing protein n=1 Tax=Candidatus Liberibacter sp. TaxID=34022 RepID=UPI0015F5ED58|nr:J domain-containing protein [Candidatus Liberibacter sp.]MBA5724007.1 J domain-containing protein [Candidatus Liberibacter sp.]